MTAKLVALLGLACIICAVLGLFFPGRLGFFMKKPTRSRTVAVYLCALMVLTMLHDGLSRMEQHDLTAAATQTEVQAAVEELGLSDDSAGTVQDSAARESTAPGDAGQPGNADAAATFRALHAELLAFKNDPALHAKGFTPGSPHAGWLQRVREADAHFDALDQFSAGVLFGELARMGEDYAKSGGSGTEYTRHMEKEITKKLHKKPE